MTSDDDAREKVLGAGFTECVRKPIMVDHLPRIIGTLTGRPRGSGAPR